MSGAGSGWLWFDGSMIAILALSMQATVAQVVPPANSVAPPAAQLPPQDWSTLPTLRFAKPVIDSPALAEFVRSEVEKGHCEADRTTVSGAHGLTVDIAVLVTPQGLVRRTVPRAIGCPSVEQYAAGIAFSRAMGNVVLDGASSDSWYRTSMAFTWPG